MRREVGKVKKPTLKDNPFSVKADIKLEDIPKVFDLEQLDKNPLAKYLKQIISKGIRYAIVVGGKGTGKTFTLKTIEEIFEEYGYTTIVVSGGEEDNKIKQKLDEAEKKLKNGEKVLLIIDDAADMPLDNFKEFISKIYKLYLDYSSFAFAIATQTEVRRTYEQVFRTIKSYTSEFTKIFGPSVDFESIIRDLYYKSLTSKHEAFVYEGLRAGVLISLDAFWGGFRSALKIEKSKQIIKEYIDFYSTGVIDCKPQQEIIDIMEKDEWLEYVLIKLLENPPKIISIDSKPIIVENTGSSVAQSLNAVSLNEILERLYEDLKEGNVKDKNDIDDVRKVLFGKLQGSGSRIAPNDLINAIDVAFNGTNVLADILDKVGLAYVKKNEALKEHVQSIKKNYKVPLFMRVEVKDAEGGVSTIHKMFFLLARLYIRQQKGKNDGEDNQNKKNRRGGGSQQLYSSDRRKIRDLLQIKELESVPNHITVICDKFSTLNKLLNIPEFRRRYEEALSNLEVLVIEDLSDRDKAVILELSRLSQLQGVGSIPHLEHLVKIFYSTVLLSISLSFRKPRWGASWLAKLLLPKIVES
ncbi:AAA family ATPase [Pyrococcus kukulkanii]|uniref:hypothetical protein n=1 Tax=Pyrococcus kukulkanii TaxID=1609559 RepID=UPI0035689977